jgi:lysyl-tRNA synthetase class 1
MGETEASRAHWADEVADEVVRSGRPVVLSTGISPSGEIHIGNMREVLTADAVYRALGDRGVPAAFHFVADSLDPLRRVYPFLDPAAYEPLVGHALASIPCPCGAHRSYAEHFLAPFVVALGELRVAAEVLRADQLYASGRMTPWVVRALEGRAAIARILHEVTGKEIAAEWSPFQPACASCGQMHRVRVIGFDARAETVAYACSCGHAGEVAMAGGGKLTWRVDWPARWSALGVTVEPFGKDHATRGGSYDTGARIAREVFGQEPPYPIPYEWIRLKGQGDMSSSRGNVLSIGRVLEIVPPEVLRYLVMRERPSRTIDFDPGTPLLQLVDQLDDATARGRDERAVELSRAGGFRPVGVPFQHLVIVAQAARFDTSRVLEILRRQGYAPVEPEAVTGRMGYARRWLDAFAPEDVRFEVQERLPDAARELPASSRELLGRLARALDDAMDAETIHRTIYELATGSGVAPAEAFRAIYVALLGKPRGPRAGWFLSLLGPSFCAARFREAAAAA